MTKRKIIAVDCEEDDDTNIEGKEEAHQEVNTKKLVKLALEEHEEEEVHYTNGSIVGIDKWKCSNGRIGWGFLRSSAFVPYVKCNPDFLFEPMEDVINLAWKSKRVRSKKYEVCPLHTCSYYRCLPIQTVKENYCGDGWKVGHLVVYNWKEAVLHSLLNLNILPEMHDRQGRTLLQVAELTNEAHRTQIPAELMDLLQRNYLRYKSQCKLLSLWCFINRKEAREHYARYRVVKDEMEQTNAAVFAKELLLLVGNFLLEI